MKRLGMMALCLGMMAASMGKARPDDGWTPLFNGKDLSGWKVFLDPKKQMDPEKAFTVKDGVLMVEGSVNGYIATEKEYGDYELRLQWRWGEKPGRGRNSGVLLHMSGPDKIWPKSFEAQLFNSRAGDIWLVDGFKMKVDDARKDPKQARHFFRMKDNVEKPIGEWNQYVIAVKGGATKIWINGELVNEASDAESTKGRILLQSEGAEIQFRNIEIRPNK